MRAATYNGAVDLIGRFQDRYPFPFDDFQIRACRALADGRSALVCAPTGAGKTVAGEFAVWLALEQRRKAFYTTPVKALSNQKFGDLIARHGAANVGLLTGDNSINGEAPIVVMTTEVLRNMLYERSATLGGLGFVVLDEVHYLKDPYRGAVWEEVLIHLAPDVQIAALSATVSNADEFAAWLETVRGSTEVVVEERRPVPLEPLVLLREELHPMFVSQDGGRRPNPALRRRSEHEVRRAGGRGAGRGRGRDGGRRFARADRAEIVGVLEERGMLPGIVFIFSRAGCDGAVRECRAAGITLTDPGERERIREYVSLRAAVLPDEDLAALGYEEWLDGLERGLAAHHAGMIPLFKETVEELFERALVKAVFATETLALGINMPAKTVVIERPVKFTGERHEMLTPADYTQLTGRAGRRGIDEIGYGVVVFPRDLPFDRLVELATLQAYPLTSSFRPSYNMAVNLTRRYPVEEALRLVNLSFGQFQADRGVTRLARNVARNERAIEGYRARVECDRGDFMEYVRLLRGAEEAERDAALTGRRERSERIRAAMDALRPGHVVTLPGGRRSRLAAVVEVRRAKRGESQTVVLGEDRRVGRLSAKDFRDAPGVVGEIRLPRGDPRSASFRHEVARRLERLEPGEERPLAAQPRRARASAARRAAVREHPCDDCPDREDHLRWADRLVDLESETERLRRRVRSRTESLARTFERVLRVLEGFGYVREGALTTKGERLCRIYNEADLLLAEALERGALEELEPPELAAAASALVYEARSYFAGEVTYPADRVRRAHQRLMRLYREVRAAEEQQGLELTREPDPGFAEQIYWWARGEPLDEVLGVTELSAGDFVRTTKQLWDLLKQLEDVAPTERFAQTCREAHKAIYRGVVAYSSTI